MTISPYTLNSLYNQGTLDYVPYDLCGGVNVSSFSAMPNPYMNSAMQGSLYQNYGMGSDYFCPQTGMGGNFSAANNGFGGPQAGINGFGMLNGSFMNNNPQAGLNGFGGGIGEFGKNISKVPNFVKGLLSGAIIAGTAVFCLRGHKKAPVNTESFLSKLKFWKK